MIDVTIHVFFTTEAFALRCEQLDLSAHLHTFWSGTISRSQKRRERQPIDVKLDVVKE
jgi:hypothetical protein